MIIVTGYIFTYVISSVIIFLIAARLMNTGKDQSVNLFMLTFGLGPITISWLLSKALAFFPGHGDIFYILFVSLFFAAFFLYGVKKLYLIAYLTSTLIKAASTTSFRTNRTTKIVLAIVLILTGILFLHTTVLPLTGHDPLEYAKDSQLIYEYRDAAVYPFNKTEPRTGFYAPSLHPLGYISLMVWSYMLQGSGEYAGLLKHISPVYVLYTMLLLWHVLARLGNIYGPLGMLLLISTPLYYSQAAICHIDPIRVYTFFLSFVWLHKCIQDRTWQTCFLAGYVVAMSMFSHSIGLLTLPFVVCIYFLASRDSISRRLSFITIIVVTAVAFGGYRYISNYVHVGSPVSDINLVLELEKLDYQDYLRQSRGLFTNADRIIFGALKGFTKLDMFGLSYWLFALFLITGLGAAKRDSLSMTFLASVLVFFGAVSLSMIVGMDEFIKNDRYMLTVHPFIAYGGAVFLGTTYEKICCN